MAAKNLLQEHEGGDYNNCPTVPKIINSSYIRPKMSGQTDMSGLFKEVQPEHRNIDARFQDLILNSLGETFCDGPQEYFLFETEHDRNNPSKASNFDTNVISSLHISHVSTPAEIRANIQYLATVAAGRWMLILPQGEKEVRFLLGYLLHNNRLLAAYMEYEWEKRTHLELDFHVRHLDRHEHHPFKGFAAK